MVDGLNKNLKQILDARDDTKQALVPIAIGQNLVVKNGNVLTKVELDDLLSVSRIRKKSVSNSEEEDRALLRASAGYETFKYLVFGPSTGTGAGKIIYSVIRMTLSLHEREPEEALDKLFSVQLSLLEQRMVGIWADLYSPERYRKYSDAQKKFIDLIMNIPRDKDRDLDFYTVVYLYRHLSIALYGMEVGIDNRQNVLSEEWKKSNAGLIYKKYMSYSFYINADDIEAKVSKIKEWKRHMQDRYSSLNIKPVRLAEKDMDGLVDIFI